MIPSTTSVRLCGRILVAIPTAIPDAPLTNRVGMRDGITVGSTFAPLIINTTTTPPKYTLQTATVMDYIETDCQGNETTFQSIFNWASIGFDQEEFISEDGKTMQGSRDIVVEPSRTTTHHEWLFTKSLE